MVLPRSEPNRNLVNSSRVLCIDFYAGHVDQVVIQKDGNIDAPTLFCSRWSMRRLLVPATIINVVLLSIPSNLNFGGSRAVANGNRARPPSLEHHGRGDNGKSFHDDNLSGHYSVYHDLHLNPLC